MPNIFKPFKRALGPCDKRNLEKIKEAEFSQKIGMQCEFFGKNGIIEKVDSQHLYVRDEKGNLHIVKHLDAQLQ